jgi:DNA-binding transcriptional LysR family regulator
MDFKQIEAFVNVAKYKSFSKAAEAIYLSQPTVSAHIASLEQELNVTLFDRAGKEVRITKAGAVFLEYAINLINIRNTAVSSLADFDTKVSGKLHIASSTTPCRFLLPNLVKSFYDIYPEVEFDIKEDSTKNVVEALLSGMSDIGIVGEVLEDPRLSFKKIDDDSLVLVSNMKDLKQDLKIEEIFKYKFIMREKGSATRNIFEKALKSAGYIPEKLNVFAEVSSLEAVIQFVKNGIGLSVVSALACQDLINAGLIRKHSVEGLTISRGIYSVIPVKRTLPPVAKAFFNHITGQ